MAKEEKSLERDLGLWSVIAISIGAMMGSGIFILPGLAYLEAGPAVILAFMISGLLVLPAALAKCEMATAMPEDGGTYIYIERSMGPLMGTIAGLGNWFSRSFKGALALVGGAPYIHYVTGLPVMPLAMGIGLALIIINIIGVRQSGRTQIALVALMGIVLAWFMGGSAGSVDPDHYSEFFAEGIWGIIAAAGMVYVSFAGVSTIASLAGEVKNPDRNLPLGIILSFVITLVLYAGIVTVVVGVLPPDRIAGSETTVAEVADLVMSDIALYAVAIAAVMALISTANAGILSSSRYPFAMSRDTLLPEFFSEVHPKTHTPVKSIAVTGAIVLALVFVPIIEIAKLASAYQILVFAFENMALIAFRNSDAEGYEPTFYAPGYPWFQWVGIAGGGLLLVTMGWVPIIGAIVIIGGSILWYLWHTEEDLDREGSVRQAMRKRVEHDALTAAKEILKSGDEQYSILIALSSSVSDERSKNLLRIAAAMARRRNGKISIVWFETVPPQAPLEAMIEKKTDADNDFGRHVRQLADNIDIPTSSEIVVTRDARRAIVNKSRREGVDLLILELSGEKAGFRPFWSDPGWIQRYAPCDVLLLQDKGLDQIDKLYVMTDSGPYDPFKLFVADAIAVASEAGVVLLYGFAPGSTSYLRNSIMDYLDNLTLEFNAPVTIETVEARDFAGDLAAAVTGGDLILVSSEVKGLLRALRTRPIERLIDQLDTSVLYVRSHDGRQISLFRRMIWDRIF